MAIIIFDDGYEIFGINDNLINNIKDITDITA